jgi:hypothetical protein
MYVCLRASQFESESKRGFLDEKSLLLDYSLWMTE